MSDCKKCIFDGSSLQNLTDGNISLCILPGLDFRVFPVILGSNVDDLAKSQGRRGVLEVYKS